MGTVSLSIRRYLKQTCNYQSILYNERYLRLENIYLSKLFPSVKIDVQLKVMNKWEYSGNLVAERKVSATR